MKKTILAVVAIFLTITYFSCTKDKTSSCTQLDTVNTYTNSVKVILDAECATGGCHNAVSARAGIRLDNFTNSVSAAKGNSKFFCSIDWTCGPQMPEGAPQLDTARLHAIQRWRDNCFPE